MEADLLPCPFCGGKAFFYEGKVYCEQCNVWCNWYGSNEYTVKAWNSRPSTVRFVSRMGTFCISCGSEIGEHDKFCHECGRKVEG